MQLNKKKAGIGSCLANEAQASPPGSDYQSIYFRNHLKILIIFFFGIFTYGYVAAGEPNPKITINKKNSTLQEVFKEIQKQTKYAFVYNSEMMRETKRIDIEVKDASLEQVLIIAFKDQPLTYSIVDQIVVVRQRKEQLEIGTADTLQYAGKPLTSITGVITDELKYPVSRASILVKGSRKATATDNFGNFTLTQIPADATLIVTCVGFEKKEYVLHGNDRVIVQMKVSPNKLDETIVVAYNTTSQKANTGAVTVVKGEQIATLPNRSLDKSLQGLVPGLLVTSGSGQPGGATSNFVLRGIATGGNPITGETYRNPLIVIDGVPVSQESARPRNTMNELAPPESNPMAQLNPSDVETISILKDAAAVALYGSRASNGVIMVTTKKGKTGKTVFTVRSQTDFSTRLKGRISALNQAEYLELLYETYRNSRPGITDAEIFSELYSGSPQKFPTIVKSPGDTSLYPAPDWEAALYRSSALTTVNEIGLSGGNDKANFYLNLEYTKQNGVVRNTGYDRKSVRFNYEYRATKWFKMGLNTTMSYNIQDFNSENSYSQIMAISPLNPISLIDGTYRYNYQFGLSTDNTSLVPNPVASAKMNVSRNTSFRGLSRLTGELRFLKHFTIVSLVGVDFMSNEARRKIRPEFALANEAQAGFGMIGEINTRTANIITTNTVRFDKTFNRNHTVNIMAGQEAQIHTRKDMMIEFNDISENPDQEYLTGKVLNHASGSQNKQTLLSYFAQANYNFKGKYFASGSMRRDGSSQFGKNERFGNYWSAGIGWVISEEPFMKSSGKFLDYLKLRSSFGPSGNSAAILDQYKFDYYSIVRNGNTIAILPDMSRTPGNPGIKWEETFSWDVGLETRFAKERITITADYYQRKTTNLIATSILLPTSTGYLMYADNIGDVNNTGIELSLSAELIKSRDFRWQVNANWSRNRNKLVKSYYPKMKLGNGVANEVGREYNSFYLPIWAGVNKDNGRPMWIDSVTGKPTENIDAARSEFVGKTQPDGFGSITNSFSYKGFQISAMLYYQYGFQIYDNSPLLLNDGMFPFLNQSRDALDRWRKPGDQAKNPRRLFNGRTGGEVDEGTEYSTRYLSDGDFIRLSNIQLAYIFPRKITDKLSLSFLRFYLQGNNLATWTKYNGQDPENGNSNGQGGVIYPQQRTYSIGINASF